MGTCVPVRLGSRRSPARPGTRSVRLKIFLASSLEFRVRRLGLRGAVITGTLRRLINGRQRRRHFQSNQMDVKMSAVDEQVAFRVSYSWSRDQL
jgi:hypothetical protein